MNSSQKIELQSRIAAKQFTIDNLKIKAATYKVEKTKLTEELRKLRERRDHVIDGLQEEINRSNNINIKKIKRKKKAEETKKFKGIIRSKQGSIDVVSKNIVSTKLNLVLEKKDLNILKAALASLA